MATRSFLVLVALVSFAARARGEIRIDTRLDVEYARRGDLSLKLDAHVPAGAGPFPAIVMVHGGGWRNMNKDHINIAPLFPVFDRTGMAWFTIDYRLAPQHHYPAAVDDVLDAVRWVQKHAREYRIDPTRIALIGESAGGHLVAQAAVKAGPDVHLAAVVPFYTIYDLMDLTKPGDPGRSLREFLGIEDLSEASLKIIKDASPRTHMRKGLPPFLMVCGTEDKINYDAAVKVCPELRAMGNSCDLFTVKGGIHGVINWEKEADQRDAYKAYLTEWLRKTLVERPVTGRRRS